MDSISLADAVKLVDSGAVVSMTYVQFDKKRKTGGKKKVVPEMVVTRTVKDRKRTDEPAGPRSNHFDNFTRNFFVCVNGKPTAAVRTVHLYLMLYINDKKVMA